MNAAQRGFTIVELLVTVMLVSILASVAFPLMGLVNQRNKEAELRRSLMEIRRGLDLYKKAVEDGHVFAAAGQSGYPPTLESLQEGVADIKSASGGKMYFLRKIPRDPFFPDPSVPASDSWGKRSYASSPDDPKSGADVFDIFSRSEGTGLNGIRYREW
ncbi:type II secretion system protein [Herbaspirillum sp. C9C3]|uniref:type II secretion system protein n=1 Tax=Herbaspirillum sp. C9C3 TaxID=2735271 RepID=UPI001584AADB|nr:type II secretion system protein [Herbaspirillum sp. C9C3]NUT60849.1 type II secretion system protein [Herbaspirillum sp. C9C3]